MCNHYINIKKNYGKVNLAFIEISNEGFLAPGPVAFIEIANEDFLAPGPVSLKQIYTTTICLCKTISRLKMGMLMLMMFTKQNKNNKNALI